MKSAIRGFLQRPALNLLVIFALALGLGANTAVFSVVNGVLLKPLPFDEVENLFLIRETKLPVFPEFSASPGNFVDWQKQNTVFESMGAWSNVRFNLIEGDQPEVVNGALVTATLMPTVRLKPMIGREFSVDEDRPGAANVVILSYRLWQRRFGGNESVLGRSVNLSARSYTVIGVMPPAPMFPNDSVDVFAPIAFTAAQEANHGSHYLRCIARLKKDVSGSRAITEMETIAKRLEEQYPATNGGWGVKVVSLTESVVGGVRTTLLVLLGAVVFVLFIACANVANLLLIRANARQREMAIRVAIGASRWQVIRHVLAESLLISCLGGAAGVVLAYGGVQALLTLAPQVLPRIPDVRIDTAVLSFTLLISILTGLMFGLVPALHSSKPNLNDTLKEGGRGNAGGRKQHIRHVLVIAEVAVSLVLLVGAGLLIRSFARLQNVSPGFDPHNALAISIGLPAQKYSTDDQRRQFVDRMLEEIGTIPGVESVGVGHVAPFTSDYVVGVVIDGAPPAKPGEDINSNYYAVTPGYFKAMGISVIRGRTFTDSDTKDSPRVAVINESFANRFFPNENPIGKRIVLTQGPTALREIVGVVADVKQYQLDQQSGLQAYEPYAHMPFSSMNFVVRTGVDPATLSQSVGARILSVDKDQPVAAIRALDQAIADSIGPKRFSAWLLVVFAGVALLLATVGLYGVMAYLVTQRTHEIGLRMALGAPRLNVFRLIIGQGMLLTVIGLAVGLAGSLALTRLMETMLYEISTTDPLTFVGIPIVLAVVALLACYLPARRAMKVDPMIALHYE